MKSRASYGSHLLSSGFDQPVDETLSLKDMKGLILLVLFLLKFIITFFFFPTYPGGTEEREEEVIHIDTNPKHLVTKAP